MSRAPSAAWLRPLALATLLGLGLALLLRWPLSLFPDALPHDPNSALHSVMAADLAAHGHPGRLFALDFPEGVPVRRVAWPLLLLALPFQAVLAPVPALNLALVLLLAAQVVGVFFLARAEGARGPARAALALGAALAPTTLLFLGNGQPENVVFFPILLAGWGARRGGPRGLLLCALGLSLAAWSSPYQAVVAGAFALAGATSRGGEPCCRCCWSRRCAPCRSASTRQPGGRGARGGPGPHPARGRRPPRAGQLERAAHPGTRPGHGAGAAGWQAPDRRWPRSPATGAYLGLALVVGGGLGLWTGRKDPSVRAIAGAGATCLLLALGSSLHLSPSADTGLPLPWLLVGKLPGLKQMGATMRFLTGVELALALGVARLVGRHRGRLALLTLALLVDALLLSPGRWPVAGSAAGCRPGAGPARGAHPAVAGHSPAVHAPARHPGPGPGPAGGQLQWAGS